MRRLLAPVALLLCACATPYQPAGFKGGYSEEKLAPGRYLVRVVVNGYTSVTAAEAYALRRARELCAAEGGEVVQADVRTSAESTQREARPWARAAVQCGGAQ